MAIECPALETHRCRLVRPTEAHAERVLEIFGDPDTMRYMQQPPLPDRDACLRMMGVWKAEQAAEKGFHWVAVSKGKHGVVLGVAALHGWSHRHRRVELGSYLHPEAWGRGLSTELSRVVMAFAFDHLDVHRVELRCDPRNAASTAIARKLGFRFEGVLRDFVQVDGKGFVDEAVHAMLAEEFRADIAGRSELLPTPGQRS